MFEINNTFLLINYFTFFHFLCVLVENLKEDKLHSLKKF